MVSPFLAAGIGAGVGGITSGLSGLFGGGVEGAGKMTRAAKAQADLAKRQAKMMTRIFEGIDVPGVQDAYRQAMDRGSQFPSGVPAWSPETRQAFGLTRQIAGQPTGAGPLRQLGMQTLRGDFLDPASNPFLAGTIESATRPTLERLGEVSLPGLQSAAIGGGAYGGNRPEMVGQALTRDASREALDIANQIGFQNYGQERDRQMQAGNMLGQAFSMGLLPAQALAGVGGAKEARQGQLRGEAQQRYGMETEAIRGKPLAGLPDVLSLLAGAPTAQYPFNQPQQGPGQIFNQALQGAAGGGMLGLSIQQALQGISAPQTQYSTPSTGYGGAGFSYPYYGGPR